MKGRIRTKEIELIPDKESCVVCGKDLSECNQGTIIDDSGKRIAFCEECFQKTIEKRKG